MAERRLVFCDCRNDFYDRTLDESGNWAWQCSNCGKVTPMRKSSKQGTDKTPSQERLEAIIKSQVWTAHTYGNPGEYEFKQWTTEMRSGLLFIVSEIGRKGDEGTAASLLCRDYRHILVGRKGGIQLLNAKEKSRSRGLFNAVHMLSR